jgi:RNA polymerase sigma factor (TIGR02999 family)
MDLPPRKSIRQPSRRNISAKTVTGVASFSRYHEILVKLNHQASQTTQLLVAWAHGDLGALDALTPRVYKELRRMAMNFMKAERDGQTLQATALVHEVYLRLVDVRNVDWAGKAHFFSLCAQMMRRILVDQARKRSASKYGGGRSRIELNDALDLTGHQDRQLIALNDALAELTEADPRKAKVVELRYFGGLSVKETAVVLKVSEETITRDWRIARGWLLSEMTRAATPH